MARKSLTSTSSVLQVSMRILRSSWFVFQAVIKNFNKHVTLDEALSPGIPFGQDLFLLELVDGLAFLDTVLDRGRRFLQHGCKFSQVVFCAQRAMAGNDLHVIRNFSQDLLVAGNHSLYAAAALDVGEGEHAIEEIITHVDHVGLLEENHAVAIGMTIREMDGMNVLAVQMHGDVVFKSDDRKSILVRRLGFAESGFAATGQSLAHVLLRDDWGFFAKMGVAAGVVAMPMCV